MNAICIPWYLSDIRLEIDCKIVIMMSNTKWGFVKNEKRNFLFLFWWMMMLLDLASTPLHNSKNSIGVEMFYHLFWVLVTFQNKCACMQGPGAIKTTESKWKKFNRSMETNKQLNNDKIQFVAYIVGNLKTLHQNTLKKKRKRKLDFV